MCLALSLAALTSCDKHCLSSPLTFGSHPNCWWTRRTDRDPLSSLFSWWAETEEVQEFYFCPEAVSLPSLHWLGHSPKRLWIQDPAPVCDPWPSAEKCFFLFWVFKSISTSTSTAAPSSENWPEVGRSQGSWCLQRHGCMQSQKFHKKKKNQSSIRSLQPLMFRNPSLQCSSASLCHLKKPTQTTLLRLWMSMLDI